MLLFLLSIADEKDHAKIEYVYRRYHNDMMRVAKSRMRRFGVQNYELDAENAVQNAFVKITKYIDRIDFEADDHAIRSYVLRIVTNECASLASDNRVFEPLENHENDVADDDFVEQIEIRSTYESVVRIIAEMDERYSIPFSLRFVENMNVPEIADLLGLPEKTVYTRLYRAKKILLVALKGKKP